MVCHISKKLLFPSSTVTTTRGFFLDLHYENLVELLVQVFLISTGSYRGLYLWVSAMVKCDSLYLPPI
jgi:hypothetical protein